VYKIVLPGSELRVKRVSADNSSQNEKPSVLFPWFSGTTQTGAASVSLYSLANNAWPAGVD
jgi:hypothetical protein